MSRKVGSSGSQLSRLDLAWLPTTAGAAFALCLALGLGCNSSSEGGGTGGSTASGSGGTTARNESTSGAGGIGAGGSGGVKGSDSSETGGKSESGGSQTGGSSQTGGIQTGGKTESGGTSSRGGSTGSGGRVSAGGDTGESGSGGTTRTSGSQGGGSGVAGSTGSGSSGLGGSTGLGGSAGGGGSSGGGASGGGSTGGGTSTGSGEGKSPGCGKTSAITEYNKGNPIPITAGGRNRRYILQVPTNYDNNKPYKFILALHARDSNDKTMYDWKYYDLLSRSNNTVIFAAPNGEKNGQPCSATSVGDSGCGWPNGNIPLMDAVAKEVTNNFCVDMNHIYATGWSYGASMSYEIACQRPLQQAATNGWGVRAIAIYSGAQMSGSCQPSTSNPVAFYESHGTTDNVLGYDGGVNLAKKYATANGCSAFSPAKTSGAHICTNATNCKTGYPTEFCSFVGGHTPYPDGGQPGSSWGPTEVWKFFEQF